MTHHLDRNFNPENFNPEISTTDDVRRRIEDRQTHTYTHTKREREREREKERQRQRKRADFKSIKRLTVNWC